jgi:cell division transport system ATP-binding protein
VIEFVNVSKTYPSGIQALKNVTFKISKGDFVFIVGPSGCGKSTLIKLLMKEEEVTSGKVKIGDMTVTSLNRHKIPFLRRNMGIVFQDFRLLPNKTVYENVAFAMQITEASPKHIRRQVPLILGLVGLSKRAKQYPHELSGGEQQRVALARAMVNNPSVLLADEPTGNLDPDTAMEIMALLNDINRRGTTVVVVTHAKDIVDNMKKRVVSLDKGYVISDQEKGGYICEA